MLGEFNNLALGDASDVVQMQPAFSLHCLGSFRRTRKCVPDHRYRDYRGGHHSQHNIQIKQYKIQHPELRSKVLADIAGEPAHRGSNRKTATKKGYSPEDPTQRSLPESAGS